MKIFSQLQRPVILLSTVILFFLASCRKDIQELTPETNKTETKSTPQKEAKNSTILDNGDVDVEIDALAEEGDGLNNPYLVKFILPYWRPGFPTYVTVSFTEVSSPHQIFINWHELHGAALAGTFWEYGITRSYPAINSTLSASVYGETTVHTLYFYFTHFGGGYFRGRFKFTRIV